MNLHFHLKNKIIPLMHQNYKNPCKFLHPHGDFISDIIRRTKTFYDLNLLHFLRLNSNISTFLDCGAHIGNHSKFFLDFGSSVFSIEPIKNNFTLLQKNVPKAKIFNVGLGSSREEAQFITYDRATGNSNCIDVFKGIEQDRGGGGDEKSIITKEKHIIVPLDYLDLPTPTLVKIDVEGSELRVLRGAEKLLTKSTATKICIEIHSDEYLKKNNFEYNNKDIINQLKYFGFNNFRKIDSMNFFFEKT